jgi:glutathione peroxidase-family protein
MKLLIMSCFGLFSILYQPNTSLYSITCTKADGSTLSLLKYEGKKALFVVLPLADDTAFYHGLAAFQQKYQDSINIIAIPAAEIGFDPVKVQAIARSISQSNTVVLGVTITDTTSGQRSPLIEWLTRREKNNHFEVKKVTGGQKYFVDERGTLFAMMGPHVPFAAAVIDRIVQRARPVSVAAMPAH